MPSVHFFQEDVQFKLPHPRKTARWIKDTATTERQRIGELNYIFCSDQFLLSLNKKFLNHKTLTDIITFDNSDGEAELCGDIYISIERVGENAAAFDEPFDRELHRVMIHGVLHLMGYSDKTKAQKSLMRKKEEAYLSLRH